MMTEIDHLRSFFIHLQQKVGQDEDKIKVGMVFAVQCIIQNSPIQELK